MIPISTCLSTAEAAEACCYQSALPQSPFGVVGGSCEAANSGSCEAAKRQEISTDLKSIQATQV